MHECKIKTKPCILLKYMTQSKDSVSFKKWTMLMFGSLSTFGKGGRKSLEYSLVYLDCMTTGDWERTTLYFVSPRERPWRQRVFQRKTLVIARETCVPSHAHKKEHRDWCVLQRVFLDALSDVTVVLGMRQSKYRHTSVYRLMCIVFLTAFLIGITWHLYFGNQSESIF